MSSIEMALPADGSEHHLAHKPIAMDGINLDRDDEIYARTEKTGGKWRFIVDGKLVAEADDPGQVTAPVLSAWGDAVRQRCKRTLTHEDVERKLAAKEKKTQTEGGIIIPEGVKVEEEEEVAPATAVEDNPDAYVAGKLAAAGRKVKSIQIKQMELMEQQEELDAELTKAVAEQNKWTKMQGALSEA